MPTLPTPSWSGLPYDPAVDVCVICNAPATWDVLWTADDPMDPDGLDPRHELACDTHLAQVGRDAYASATFSPPEIDLIGASL